MIHTRGYPNFFTPVNEWGIAAATTAFVIIDLLQAECDRNTVRTVRALPVDGVVADGNSLLTVAIDEVAITGGRRISEGVWSAQDADGVGLTNSLSVFDAGENELHNSDSPATQTTASLATGNWTLSVFGSGSALISAGTATISGESAATEGSPNTINISGAGTVTVTVTGSLDYFQLETGDFPTPIIITAGAPASRDADINTVPTPSVLTAQSGAIEMVVDPAATGQTNVVALQSGVDSNNRLIVLVNSANIQVLKVNAGDFGTNVTEAYSNVAGTPIRIQIYWDDVIGFAIRAADASADINLLPFHTNVSTADMPINSLIEIGSGGGASLFVGEYANNGVPKCWHSKDDAGW